MEELFKEAQAQKDIHQSIDLGKKKYRFSE
jgi:hypothetical protein